MLILLQSINLSRKVEAFASHTDCYIVNTSPDGGNNARTVGAKGSGVSRAHAHHIQHITEA